MLAELQQILTILATGSGIYVAINGLNAWKREMTGKRDIELCQKVIELFYEADHKIETLRFPGVYPAEGDSRPKIGPEPEDDTRRRNILYAPLERINNQMDFWSEFFSYKFRMRALFGESAVEAFALVDEALRSFRAATLTRYQALVNDPEALKRDAREAFENAIWSGPGKHDELDEKVKRGITLMEEVCVPIVRSNRGQGIAGMWCAIQTRLPKHN